jgi:transposase
MNKSKPVFSTEFKKDAASLVLDKNHSVKEACEAVGAGVSALRRWVKQLESERQGVTPKGNAMTVNQQELQGLQARVKQLEWENMILKKATALVYSMTGIKPRLDINKTNHSALLGESPQILDLLSEIEKVASVNAPVMISGESGTGKELAAKAIHDSSGFSNGPFVTVNSGAIVAELVQSELFPKSLFRVASIPQTIKKPLNFLR